MRMPVLLLLAALAASPVHAQRNAVSADLSPEAAAAAFVRTVIGVCVPAVTGNGVSSLDVARAGQVQPTHDAATRRQAGAEAGETVWDVAEARGVVALRERAGRCVVSVYGPETAPTVINTMQSLSGEGFEATIGAAASGPGFTQTMTGGKGGRRMMVQLSAAEPGAPGNHSTFSVVTATVSVLQ